MGILQVLRLEFKNSRILDILKFHICMFKVMDKKIIAIYNLAEHSGLVGRALDWGSKGF